VSVFYLDTRALVKRYVAEVGSTWVGTLTDPSSGHTIVTAELAQVEAATAIAARQRAPGGITLKERDDAVDLLACIARPNTDCSGPIQSFSIGRFV
jgi:predicted nucleic acid-binding protein